MRQYRWKEYINRVRTSWHGQYSYGPGHHGQHDAAELLGDILHGHTSRFVVEVCVTKQVYERSHCTERLENLAMIVLLLPNKKGRFTLRSLKENYFTPVEVKELQCEECGCLDEMEYVHTPTREAYPEMNISYQSI